MNRETEDANDSSVMDTEFQFGDLEQTQPQTLRAPDCDKRFAVVACGSPGSDDLPMYVDLDSMRDMERHALSNTNVELGGVLLGGQYIDENGQPFVWITDSLRARHYEATKGSFKFTHDTWEQITRERDEFPKETHMVGWYHTHPGWGVFLSGMDLFICKHFFNKPLDAALVIDPCNDDRGFFQWVSQEEKEDVVRRTGGFYLVASRLRLAELEEFADQLEGQSAMTTRSDTSARPAYYPPLPPDPTAAWRAVAMTGMLGAQFFLLLLIAWRMTAPAPATEPLLVQRLADLEDRLASRQSLRSEESRLADQRAFLDKIVGQVEAAPNGLVQSLEEERRKSEELRASVIGQNALNQSLLSERQQLENALEELESIQKVEFNRLSQENADLESRNAELSETLSALQSDGEAIGPVAEDAPTNGDSPNAAFWKANGMWIGIVAVVAVVAGLVGLAVNASTRTDQEFSENEESAPNNKEGDDT